MDSDERPIGTLTLLACFILCLGLGALADLCDWFRRKRRSPHIIAAVAACALPACSTLDPTPSVSARAVDLQPAVQEIRKAVRVSADIDSSLARQASAIERQRLALARQRLAFRRAQLALDGKTIVAP